MEWQGIYNIESDKLIFVIFGMISNFFGNVFGVISGWVESSRNAFNKKGIFSDESDIQVLIETLIQYW